MNAILWFWLGTVAGSFVGFGCFCLLQAAHDPREETQLDNRQIENTEVIGHAQH